jgi:hypothetical protein
MAVRDDKHNKTPLIHAPQATNMNWQKKHPTDSFLKIGSTPTPAFGLGVDSLNGRLERDLKGVVLDEGKHEKSKKRIMKDISKSLTNIGLVERIFPKPNVPLPFELNQSFQDSDIATAHIRKKKISKEEPLFLVDTRRWNTKLGDLLHYTAPGGQDAQPRKLSRGDSMTEMLDEDSEVETENFSESELEGMDS